MQQTPEVVSLVPGLNQWGKSDSYFSEESHISLVQVSQRPVEIRRISKCSEEIFEGTVENLSQKYICTYYTNMFNKG